MREKLMDQAEESRNFSKKDLETQQFFDFCHANLANSLTRTAYTAEANRKSSDLRSAAIVRLLPLSSFSFL